ncbi:MAG: hypothetical protein M3540_10865 [Actinomycetota bacterium]|nr:hypothetical protein [Actinomycetota bacterium]
MRASLVLVLGAVLALAGCGGSRDAEEALSGRERLWVRNYTAWTVRTARAAGGAEEVRQRMLGGDDTARADYDRAVAPIRECRTRFDRVGPAPTKRLQAVQTLALEACADFQRWVRAESRAFDGPPGDLLLESEAAIARGNRVWLEAERKLESVFAWNRPLPVRTGEVGASRIEPRFGRVASMLANRSVQVRCWSAADWDDVHDEWQAYTDDDHDAIGFVASFDRGRLSLAPDICDLLAGLAYGGARPHGGEQRRDLAEAVETLGHEAEHLVSPGTEAATECYGMQDIRRTAGLLGADRAYANGLAELYWREIYPAKPEAYTTPLCQDGGPLDRNPASSVWP